MVLTLDTPAATAGAAPLAEKPSLAGLGREGLRAALADAGVPDKQLRMRVNQLWSWLYVRGVPDFDAMTDVAKDLRAELSQRYTLARPEIVSEQAENIREVRQQLTWEAQQSVPDGQQDRSEIDAALALMIATGRAMTGTNKRRVSIDSKVCNAPEAVTCVPQHMRGTCQCKLSLPAIGSAAGPERRSASKRRASSNRCDRRYDASSVASTKST